VRARRLGGISTATLKPFHLVELPSCLDLISGVLSPHRQVHCVSSASIRACVPQSCNILLDFPAKVVFNLQGIEVGCQVEDLSLSQFANFDGVVEVVAGHYFGASRCTDTEECFKGAPHETVLGEVDSQDEDL